MVRIYCIRRGEAAPWIGATPDNDAFAREFMRDLEELPAEAKLPSFQIIDKPFRTAQFFYLDTSVLVFNKKMLLGPLGELLTLAGNIHETKLNDTGEEIFFLNITECYNCIDRTKTTFCAVVGDLLGEELGVDHGLGISKPAFFPNLIGDSWIFKIPNMSYKIFVASDDTDRGQDFYRRYMESGLNELKFELVWEGEGRL